MYFVFTESFNIKNWNGETARTVKGVSGTHSASMYLAEAFAKMGHQVDFVSNNIIETVYRGVNYVLFSNFDKKACDYIVTTYDLNDLNILCKIKDYTKIIILMNNDLCNFKYILRHISRQKLIIGFLNEFGKTNITSIQPFLRKYNSIFLPNSIDINDIKPVSQKENSFVFFPCAERGLSIAKEVAKNFKNFKLYTNTYADENRHKTVTDQNYNTCQTEGTSKNSIFEYLSKSKYFVYPLINVETNYVHYDTFAYVVLEALLHGVVVIAPKIKVYEELYGDAICYIHTDDIIPEKDLLFWRKNNSNFGYPLVSRYIDKINELENNTELRKSYIQKGLKLKERFSNIKIANELLVKLK